MQKIAFSKSHFSQNSHILKYRIQVNLWAKNVILPQCGVPLVPMSPINGESRASSTSKISIALHCHTIVQSRLLKLHFQTTFNQLTLIGIEAHDCHLDTLDLWQLWRVTQPKSLSKTGPDNFFSNIKTIWNNFIKCWKILEFFLIRNYFWFQTISSML